MDRGHFIDALKDVPPKPAEMDEILRANHDRSGTLARP